MSVGETGRVVRSSKGFDSQHARKMYVLASKSVYKLSTVVRKSDVHSTPWEASKRF